MVVIEESHAPPRWSAWSSVGLVWAFVLAGAVVALLVVEHDSVLQWFPMLLGAATILAFCLQLALDSKVGFVNRLATTVSGSVLILAAASGILALIAPVGG